MVNPRTRALDAAYAARPAKVSLSAAELGPMDVVILAAKSTANPDVAQQLQPLLGPDTVILCLQNGLGNAEFFAREFPGALVLAGICFVCVNRIESGLVENYEPGRVEIGSLGERYPHAAQELAAAFVQAGVKCRVAASLRASLWRKLCWNVPFNGLAIAGGGMTTDQVLAVPELRRRVHRLMEEVRTVAATEGVEISAAFLRGQLELTEQLGAYQPSSLIDYLAGRPVELDSIWGEALRRGQSQGIAMPELERLYAEIDSAVSRI